MRSSCLSIGKQDEFGAAAAIHPDSPAIPVPSLALHASGSADLARHTDYQTARVHLAIDAFAVIRGTAQALTLDARRRIDGELSAAAAVHPNAALIPAPGATLLARRSADLANQLHAAASIGSAI